jgi:hypothetical protein
MRLAIGVFEFEGEIGELQILAESCKAVSSVLGAKTIELAEGNSYTLDSYEVWSDEPSP